MGGTIIVAISTSSLMCRFLLMQSTPCSAVLGLLGRLSGRPGSLQKPVLPCGRVRQLEDELQSKLTIERLTFSDARVARAPDRSRNLAGARRVGGVQASILQVRCSVARSQRRLCVVHSIEEVVHLPAELPSDFFGDGEVLEDGQIDVRIPRCSVYL